MARNASGAPELPLEVYDEVLILGQPGPQRHRSVAIAGQVRERAIRAIMLTAPAGEENTTWPGILTSAASILASALAIFLVVRWL